MKTLFSILALAACLLAAPTYLPARETAAAPPGQSAALRPPADAPPAAHEAPAAFGAKLLLAVLLSGGFGIGALRAMEDAELMKSLALPAAGATAYTTSIDVGTGPHLNLIEGRLSIPATPSLVDTKKITATMQHSDDNVTFADIPELAAVVLTGAGGLGAAAAVRDFRFPPGCKRYVRAGASVEAAGGSNIAVLFTFSILS